MNNNNYKTTEIKVQNGGKKRNVTIKKSKGSKRLTKYHKGKKLYTSRKPIHKKNVLQIKMGKIIPGLFSDFSKKTRRNKKGGDFNVQPTDDRQKQQRKLAELQSLMRENRANMQRYQELDDRLYEIEQMIPAERQLYAQEENDLTIQINELRETNNQSQQRFEQLRNAYLEEFRAPPNP
jgi:hypothetical protein